MPKIRETEGNYISLSEVESSTLPESIKAFYKSAAHHFGEANVSLALEKVRTYATTPETKNIIGRLTIYIPEVIIRNSRHKEHKATDNYVLIDFEARFSNKEDWFHINYNFRLRRTSLTILEATNNYIHSHASIGYHETRTRFAEKPGNEESLCFGNGPWPNLCADINEYSKNILQDSSRFTQWVNVLPIAWEQIKAFLGWESLEEGPYQNFSGLSARVAPDATRDATRFHNVTLSEEIGKNALESYSLILHRKNYEEAKEVEVKSRTPLTLIPDFGRLDREIDLSEDSNFTHISIPYSRLSQEEILSLEARFMAPIAAELLNKKQVKFRLNTTESDTGLHLGTIEITHSFKELEALAANTEAFRFAANYWLDPNRLEIQNNLWTAKWIRYYSLLPEFKNKTLGILDIKDEERFLKTPMQYSILQQAKDCLQVDTSFPILYFKGQPKYLTIIGLNDEETAKTLTEEQTKVPDIEFKPIITLSLSCLKTLKRIITQYVNKKNLLSGGFGN